MFVIAAATKIMNIDADKQAATPDCDCRGKGETKKLNTVKKVFHFFFVHPSLKYKMQLNISSVKWEIRQDIILGKGRPTWKLKWVLPK